MSSVHFDQVYKRYENGHEAMRHVTFQVNRGEFVFITGHSGAGKSTLLKLIMLMERPTRGQIFVDGKNLKSIGSRAMPYFRRSIGVVFQDHQLIPDRTVFDNIALPLIISGYPDKDIGRRVRAALDKVGLLKKENYYPIALSGGEQQRVGIARAVINKPTLLLADEPTGNLDPELSNEIMELFMRFNRAGVTVLIASHDRSLVQALNYRTLQLEHGSLIEEEVVA